MADPFWLKGAERCYNGRIHSFIVLFIYGFNASEVVGKLPKRMLVKIEADIRRTGLQKMNG